MSAGMREERKVVTALFADVVGSTRLMEELDPEDAREVLGAAVRRMVEAVEAFGGTIKDLAGDGVLALFGAPVAHENDAERAIRSALRIVRDVDVDESSVSVRVGIETGLVVLGPVGAGGRVEYGATGDAVNTAARLQAHAPPGGILVGRITRREVDDLFDWGAELLLELKGKSEPVSAFEVLAERFDAKTAAASVPMFGREVELEHATRVADRALSGDGGLLLVVGEPGIGKSRLVEDVRDHVSTSALTWLEGRCVSFGESTPYLPLRALVLEALGVPYAESLIDPEDLGTRVRSLDADLHDAVPYLGALVGVPSDRAHTLSPETLRLRTIDALRRLILALAERGPLVVAIEDVHWADPSTVRSLERLIPATAGTPVLFVLTTRSRDAIVGVAASAGANADVIELEPLPPDRLDELVAALLEGGGVPAHLARRVVDTADGNPFFATELVRSLVASGVLSREGRAWVVSDPNVSVELPTTIEKVVLARLDLLEPSTRDVVTAASVLGRTVTLPLVERLVGANVASETHELIRARLFAINGHPDEVSFAHALIQEVAYGSLLKRRRRELHAVAAAAIEELWPDRIEENLGVLAHHHRGAGDLEAARRCHHLAAERAERVHAGEEALEHLTASIDLAAELGKTAADRDVAEQLLARARVRARTGDADGARSDLESILAEPERPPELAMRAHDELGFVLAGAADYRAAVPHLETALEAASSLGDTWGEVSALSRLSIVHANRLDFDAAMTHGERAIGAAYGEEGAEAIAMDALKQVALETGDFETLERLAEQLAEIHRRNDDLWLLQFAVFEVAYADVARMRVDRAFAGLEEALSINRRIGDVGNEPLYVAMLGRAHRARGEYDQAAALGRRAFDLARELGHGEWIAWTAAWLGSTLLELGAIGAATDVLSVGVEAADRSGADLHLVRCVALNAWAWQRLDDPSLARECADRATSILERIRVRPPRAYVAGQDAYVAVARVRVEHGEPDVAVELVAPVVAACRACEWSDGVVDGSLVLARAALQLGDGASAVAAAEAAVDEATRVDLPTSWRAHRVLADAYRSAGEPERAAEHVAAADDAFARIAERIDDRDIRDAFASAATKEGVER
ncbi:MAG TPA: AAA family ATPase [Actinomycetota bacterium]|jgi:class 3 adenylate cyclase/tetratricopeptide (TPR) repeat protein|nr:AAA family ATPase [Actinomycetota bacterium]